MSIVARLRLPRQGFVLDTELSAPARGVTALFGPSGCGKTTLLRAIAGLERCPGGFLQVGDEVWQDVDHYVPTHKRPLGYVFQEASLFQHLTVRGNLEYGLRRVRNGRPRFAFDRAVALLGLDGFLDRAPGRLSGGERQRVAIARALLTSPGLLLMDEPLCSLDETSRADLLPFLDRLYQELDIPVLYVSHALEEVARLADHLVYLDKGRVVASGPIVEMMSRVDLPLSQGEEAAVVVQATARAYDPDFCLAHLDFDGGRFYVVTESLTPNQPVRLRIKARNVVISLTAPADSSVLNIFPAQVQAVVGEYPARTLVKLRIGGISLFSRITRKSAIELGLEPGQAVYAQVKSAAVMI